MQASSISNNYDRSTTDEKNEKRSNNILDCLENCNKIVYTH
jgi:hypothetical protein